MHLKNLHLNQFKNYKSAKLEFSEEINCMTGINGSGKTNLLDAIHYLCLTKSAFNTQDNQNILHNQDFFSLFGSFESEGGSLDVRCIVESGKKKQLLQNGKILEKMSDHVGTLPVVLIAPDDTSLIKEGSEERRRFFDSMLCQLDKSYMNALVRYQHFLKQRNALLKQFAENGRVNKLLIEPYDVELIRLSRQISMARKEFIETYRPILLDHYAEIAQSRENVGIQYTTTCLEDTFEQQFVQNQSRDILLRRTSAGIHKDDFVFEIDQYPIKKFGSQGQQKSFLIALKLAQFEIFYTKKSTKPILLLDDIFDKLDDHRIEKLMLLVGDHRFGQLFITDARPERSIQILKGMKAHVKFFRVNQGVIEEIPHQ
ncbi:DNA replication/repair protein RecF [Belliella kenyensis]|uniref:DNA replication and repair protein RecF n=1 Tax=Belliella kenyensis TaxID=1472724 RepID=A0ABV8EI56_9BACT|nr:DNA replication/repair protein RecF [Belliella kenyensis]MCH7401390.1 DNA replication/repair protein RecF [Belliella kenyensis]MDN3602833.1 DNA replication/repair protein RecF [Belliella kenyensis]